MDEVIAMGMIFSLLMVALIGGFILMYPITKRLGTYLERRIEEGSGKGVDPERLREIHGALHDLRDQIQDLQERQAFVEKLMEGRSAGALPASGGSTPPPGDSP